MKAKNSITRFLRVLIHIWWYATIAGGVILFAAFLGTQVGIWDAMNSIDFGIEWEMKDVIAKEELLISVTDQSGKAYLVDDLNGKGTLSFNAEEGLGKLSIPFLMTFITAFAIGLWMVYQLRALFDNFAKGDYFAPINSIRVKRVAYAIFGFIGVRIMTQIIFEYTFKVKTGSQISVDGVEIGISPLFLGGLILLALSAVFQEATKIKEDQDLTI